jgi:hypothetical protein
MGYSGDGGELIHEKNQKQTSRDTVPLIFYNVTHVGVLEQYNYMQQWKQSFVTHLCRIRCYVEAPVHFTTYLHVTNFR